jgi:hypothetical protein
MNYLKEFFFNKREVGYFILFFIKGKWVFLVLKRLNQHYDKKGDIEPNYEPMNELNDLFLPNNFLHFTPFLMLFFL